jgi:MHS family shikimate/dehydroshikimate transporter-like MFS transporter
LLSDAIGRRTIYVAGTLFGILLAFPIFWLFETRDATIVTWAIVAGICLCQACIFALHASFMPELFGTNVRYSGISLGFQIGAAVGGVSPVVAAAIVAWSGEATWPVSLMLATLGVLTLIAVMSTRETAARPMHP